MTISDSRPYPPKNYKGREWPRPACQRYWNFKDLVAINNIDFPEIGAEIVFILPMPKSWSKEKKERMNHRYHQQRPDLSNLLKAIEDAVYKKDDSAIADIHCSKIWGHEGGIEITNG